MSGTRETILEGGCLCGALRYRVRGEGRNLAFCHCRSCRLAAGAPYVAWGTWDDDEFEVTAGELRECRSSELVTRGFCAECGSTITYRHSSREGELDVTLATLDDPNAVAPKCHIFTSHRLAWIRLDDGLPQFEEWGLPS